MLLDFENLAEWIKDDPDDTVYPITKDAVTVIANIVKNIKPIQLLESLVRDLVEQDPTVFTESTWHVCGVCSKGLAMRGLPETHEEDCLYIAMWKWVQEYPKES